jgi:hypothetical protein
LQKIGFVEPGISDLLARKSWRIQQMKQILSILPNSALFSPRSIRFLIFHLSSQLPESENTAIAKPENQNQKDINNAN